MKIYLILCFIVISSIIKAENDSCFVNHSFTDSLAFKIQVDSNDIFNEQIINSNKKTLRKLKQNIKLNDIKTLDIFGDFWDMLSSLWSPVWGKYDESCVDMDGPFFLFDRRNNSLEHLRQQMAEIRTKIKVKSSSEYAHCSESCVLGNSLADYE
jgi:hypothetical protein